MQVHEIRYVINRFMYILLILNKIVENIDFTLESNEFQSYKHSTYLVPFTVSHYGNIYGINSLLFKTKNKI